MADRSLGFNVTTSEDFTKACKAMELAAEKFSRTLDKLDGKKATATVGVDTTKADREVGAFASRMQKRISAAIKALPDIELNADSSDADRRLVKLRSELAALSGKRIGIDISAEEAEAEVARLRAELTKLGTESASVQVKADTAAAIAALDAVEGKRKELDGKSARVKVDIDKRSFADAANAWALLSRNFQTLAKPVALAAAIPTLLEFGQAAVTSAQSLLLLPAAGAAAATVIGTIKLATVGLSDAFKNLDDPKKFAEALTKLSPQARAFALEVKAIKPAFDAMRMDVQDALFRNFAATLGDLARTYLPVLRTGFVGIATELNSAGLQVAGFVRQAQTVADVATIFHNTRAAMGELSPAGAAILQILRDTATVGSGFLPGLAAGFTEITQAAAAFVAKARETGKLREWISQGLSALGLLAQTLLNVGDIIMSIFRAANTDTEGFLHNIRDLTGRLAEFFRSAEGQQALVDAFTALRALAAAVGPLLLAVAAAALQMVQAVAPALPPLVKGVTDVFNASGSLLGVFGELAVAVLPPLGAALSALSPILGPLLLTITAMAAAMKIYSVTVAIVKAATEAWAVVQALLNGTLALNPIGLVVVALAALAAALVYAYNHSETFRTIVQAAWQGIQAAAATAWAVLKGVFDAIGAAVSGVGGFFTDLWQNWVVPAWNGITSAVATAWGVLQGIFGGIGGSVTAVGGFFVSLWHDYIEPAWNGIVQVIKIAVAIILTVALLPLVLFYQNVLAPIFTWLWREIIEPSWNGIRDVVTTVCQFLLNSVWNPIVAFFQGVFAASWNFIRDTAVASWNSIRDGVSAAYQWLLNSVWNPIIGFFQGAFATAWNFIRDTAVNAWNMLRDGINAAWQFILANIWQPIINYMTATLGPKFDWLRNVAVTAWNFLRDGFMAGWVVIRDNIWNPMVRFITQTIPQAFQTGVQAIGRLWDGIKRALRDPVQAAIDIVYNRGIVAVWNTVARLVGIGGIATYSLPGFTTGGPITGGTPGRDSVLVAAMPGEYVLSKPAVDRMGGIGAVDSFHSSLSGRGSGATATPFGMPGYQFGGAVAHGSASTAVTGSAQAVSVFDLGSLWDAVTGSVNRLADRISGSPWGQVLLKVSGKLVGSIVDFLKAKAASFISAMSPVVSGGGGNVAGVGAVGGGGARAWIIAHESGGNPRAQNPTSSASGLYQMIDSTWRAYGGSTAHAKDASVAEQNAVADRYVACVPLDAQILTRDGWKSHDTVEVGDETIGYDPITGTSRWTKVTAVHRYGPTPVVRVGNARWSVRCTANHRWVAEKLIQPEGGGPRGGGRHTYRRDEMPESQHIGTRHRIRLAAPVEDESGGHLDLALDEAELLGWILGDGSVCFNGNDHTLAYMSVDQSDRKPVQLERLRSLMRGFPHSENRNEHGNHWSPHGCSRFRLTNGYARGLLTRSGYEGDLEIMVMRMSHQQRVRFIEGVFQADGHLCKNGSRMISQNEGVKLDAITTALYMVGHHPHRAGATHYKQVHFRPPFVKPTVRAEPAGAEPVWCPTTELGSWTMRQDGQIMLTGNSRYGSWENAQRFWISHHFYDRGGLLPPGATMAYNSTGQPERVLSPAQTKVFDQIAAAVSGGGRAFGGDNAVIAELRYQNRELRALRGDVDQGGYFGALIGEVRALRQQLASVGSSAGATAQGWRTSAELGAWP